MIRSCSSLPPVLVPCFDLCISEIEFGGQLLPVLNTEILLLLETPFQRLELIIRECRPGFPLFSGVITVRVGGIVGIVIICSRKEY